jgi:hypothetical protein
MKTHVRGGRNWILIRRLGFSRVAFGDTDHGALGDATHENAPGDTSVGWD